MPPLPFDVLAAYAVALALSLVLAAWFTPRDWWRRPTLRGGAVLAGGTLAFGTLLLALTGRSQPAPVAQLAGTPLSAATLPATLPAALKKTPAAGASYRVVGQLNLRTGSGVHAARVAVLPAGSRVIASGAVDGDWWQVRTRVDGRLQTGWASSLWLRRGDEG